MPTNTLVNPHSKAGRKIDRWAKAHIEISYIDPSGEKRTVVFDTDLEEPVANHPNYQIGIREL